MTLSSRRAAPLSGRGRFDPVNIPGAARKK
jgi:hypothetical protein